MTRVLVIVPAHNEARAIVKVVGAVKALGHLVLVIDDGSTDGTGTLAKDAGALVIATGVKSGKGNALRLGFDDALKRDIDVVLTLDGDGQHDPADIKTFIECYERTHAGLINGNRLEAPKGMPLLRLLTNRFMSWLISCMCKQQITDSQCGFRLVSKEMLVKMRLTCNDFEIETEMLVEASKHNCRIENVPIATIYRDEVSKIRPLKDTWRFIVYLWTELRKR